MKITYERKVYSINVQFPKQQKYTSREFEDYLRKKGILHERTVPKTTEQNEITERMNRTLEETVRAMLSDSKLHEKILNRNYINSFICSKLKPDKCSTSNDTM